MPWRHSSTRPRRTSMLGGEIFAALRHRHHDSPWRGDRARLPRPGSGRFRDHAALAVARRRLTKIQGLSAMLPDETPRARRHPSRPTGSVLRGETFTNRGDAGDPLWPGRDRGQVHGARRPGLGARPMPAAIHNAVATLEQADSPLRLRGPDRRATAPRIDEMSLEQRMTQGRPVVAPGIYDALTASLATEAGFEAVYLSGAAIAYTRLGRPDIGLVSMSEVADVIALVRDRVPTPMIVDADNGYGNALNVQRTVRAFERAGASAIQIEDQTMPKRCGHLQDKSLIGAGEMAGKIRAAVDAPPQPGDPHHRPHRCAVAVEGLRPRHRPRRALCRRREPTCCSSRRRARASSSPQITSHVLGSSRPLLVNMVEGGDTPARLRRASWARLGFSIVHLPRRHRPRPRPYRPRLLSARCASMAPTNPSASACSISPR